MLKLSKISMEVLLLSTTAILTSVALIFANGAFVFATADTDIFDNLNAELVSHTEITLTNFKGENN